MVLTAITWSGSVAWRMPRKNPMAMMDSKPIMFFTASAAAGGNSRGTLGSYESQELLHTIPGFSGDLEDLHPWAYCLNVRQGGDLVEFDGLGQIHLAEYGNIGAVENRWILERLVLSLGDGGEHQAQV